jgi:hypothetical protein
MKTIMTQLILLAVVAAATIPAAAFASAFKASPRHVALPKAHTGGKITGVNAGHNMVKKLSSGVAEYRAGGNPIEIRNGGSQTYNHVPIKRGVTPNQGFQQWQQQATGSGGGASRGGAAGTKCHGC